VQKSALRWHEDVVSREVRERRLEVFRGERSIPALLWTPAPAPSGERPQSDGERPLVLIGHGASGSKREEYVVSLARRLVRHHGFVAAAIDGPVHGDRRVQRPGRALPGMEFLDFSQMWAGDATMTDEMVADWQTVLDVLSSSGLGGAGPVAYWGVSMGTILGLPFVAAEPRIGAAVLGLMGATGPTRERIEADARRVRCPVLFLVQWDDELFPRGAAFELFGTIATTDKRLHANTGRHGEVPMEEFAATEAFLAAHLTPSDERPG
jgi:dienelactone hydrolase